MSSVWDVRLVSSLEEALRDNVMTSCQPRAPKEDVDSDSDESVGSLVLI